MRGSRKGLILMLVCAFLAATIAVAFATPQDDLMKAIRDGDTAKVRQMLDSGFNPNDEVQDYDWGPVIFAVQYDRLEILKLLVAKKARLDLRAQGMPPLGLAAQMGRTAIFEYLMTLNLDAYDKGCALATFARDGNTDQVSRMLRAGAPPNATIMEGSALAVAARSGYSGIAIKLLAAGADANLKYETGISGPRVALLDALPYPDTVKVLIRGGADVDYRKESLTRPAEEKENTLLMIAARKAYFDTVRLLVEAGADVKAKTPAGDTATMSALKNGQTAVAEYLAAAELLPGPPPVKQ